MRLEKITTTNTQKIFKVKIKTSDGKYAIKTFFADNLKSNDFDINKKYNKNSLSATRKYGEGVGIVPGMLSSALVHNMYSSKNPFYKSAIYKTSKTNRSGTSTDFLNITNHKLSSELVNSVLIENSIYALEPYTNIGHCNVDIDINTWLSSDYTAGKLIQRKIKTMIYDREYIKNNISSSIDSTKCILSVYDDIKYNMLYEMNGNIYNDYESSIILANTLKCKNLYNCTYDMKHENNLMNVSSKYLKNARIYVDVQKCNNLLYLKYYDVIDYSKDSITINDINEFNLKIPNIEVVDSINRYVNFNAHKTNIFSIVIETDLFKIIQNSDNLKEYVDIVINNIKLLIKNCINMIIPKLIPVNSQLFNIYFIDKQL